MVTHKLLPSAASTKDPLAHIWGTPKTPLHIPLGPLVPCTCRLSRNLYMTNLRDQTPWTDYLGTRYPTNHSVAPRNEIREQTVSGLVKTGTRHSQIPRNSANIRHQGTESGLDPEQWKLRGKPKDNAKQFPQGLIVLSRLAATMSNLAH